MPSSTGKRVLVLSASAGAGHMRAADALVKDFQSRPDVAAVEHWDTLKYTTAMFRHLYSKIYLNLVNKAPQVLGWVYRSTDTPWKTQSTQAFEKFNAAKFIDALKTYNPDVVVCTHFTPSGIISWLNKKKKLSVKCGIVVTDLDCHALWLAKTYRHYFVALEETKIYMSRLGISADRITVSGIPIDPVFRTPRDKAATRQSLGLDPERLTILVSAGGFGVGPIETLIQELLRLTHKAQVVAIAGKSAELKSKLEKLAASIPGDASIRLHPIGFTTQMDEYMAASDILLSKPGGLTTSEAMARGLPMCIVNPIPGQEERNADHLLELGVAIKANNAPTLAWKLDTLFGDPARLARMQAAAKAFGKPFAGQQIVNELMQDS
jgi:processive 1,2-diacylglycerol beta-glucosyltransferase